MTTTFLNISSSYSHKFLLIAVSCLMIAAFTGIALAEDKPASAAMEMSFRNNLISADLVDAPLIDVLQRIKQEFGFKTHFYGDLDEKITLSVTDMPLDKFLRQLTANHSLSVAFLSATKAPEQDQTKQIAEIWVLSRSTASKSMNLAPATPVSPSNDFSDEMVRNMEKTQGDQEEPGNTGQDSDPVGSVNRQFNCRKFQSAPNNQFPRSKR